MLGNGKWGKLHHITSHHITSRSQNAIPISDHCRIVSVQRIMLRSRIEYGKKELLDRSLEIGCTSTVRNRWDQPSNAPYFVAISIHPSIQPSFVICVQSNAFLSFPMTDLIIRYPFISPFMLI